MNKDEFGTRHGNAGSGGYRPSNDERGGEPKKRRRRVRKPDGEVRKITQAKPSKETKPQDTRLNKYISNSGICSRREADKLIEDGRIKVDGEVVTTLGFKVLPGQVVLLDDKEISPTKKVYLMLNKPKDYITTTHDPQNRKTVMDLVQDVDADRVYPVGRLDRNTTGLLIFTNDGELAQRLMHPRGRVTKVYSVELNKPLESKHLYKLKNGIKLFDGFMKPDKIAMVDPDDWRKIGVEIHIGRNRIVRRMFEALGYEVDKLDRVIYGGLDKRGVARGTWRNLTEKEISQLQRVSRIR